MTGQVTSLQSAGAWSRFAGFLRRPELPGQATGMRRAAFPVLGKLFALDLLLMAGLVALAGALVALGLEMPGHMLETIGLGPGLIAFMLIGAPIGEEIVFRGWLSGRPGHVWASIALLAGGAVFLLAILGNAGGLGRQGGLAALAGGGLLAALLLLTGRGRPPMPFFRRHFRWFYFASTLAFAGVHLTNFSAGPAMVLLPLTLPQLLLGLILGYARVQFGLWASVLLHMAHNSLFVGLLLAGTA